MLKKIVIIGPESTGKSTLCTQLAAHYKTQWCPEYAREYLLANGTNYSFDDLLTIAKGQLGLEEKYSQMPEDSRQMTDNCLATPGSPNTELSEQPSLPDSYDSLLTTHYSRLATHHSLLFIDTDQYVMKVWCEYVFNDCHNWILRRIPERKYDLYLLCKPDLLWVKDELREYPNEKPRQELYHIYKDIMVNQKTPWVDISGSYEERLQKAIYAVNRLKT